MALLGLRPCHPARLIPAALHTGLPAQPPRPPHSLGTPYLTTSSCNLRGRQVPAGRERPCPLFQEMAAVPLGDSNSTLLSWRSARRCAAPPTLTQPTVTHTPLTGGCALIHRLTCSETHTETCMLHASHTTHTDLAIPHKYTDYTPAHINTHRDALHRLTNTHSGVANSTASHRVTHRDTKTTACTHTHTHSCSFFLSAVELIWLASAYSLACASPPRAVSWDPFLPSPRQSPHQDPKAEMMVVPQS